MAESYVERTSDDPSEAEVGAGETPTRFVFGRPDCPWLCGRDARHKGGEIGSAGRSEGLKDSPESAVMAVPRCPAEIRPGLACLFDMAKAEICDLNFCRDPPKDSRDGSEAAALCDGCTDASDCAAGGPSAFCFVSCLFAPMAVGNDLRCRLPSGVRQSAKYLPFFSYIVTSGHLRLNCRVFVGRFYNPVVPIIFDHLGKLCTGHSFCSAREFWHFLCDIRAGFPIPRGMRFDLSSVETALRSSGRTSPREASRLR